MPGFTINIPGIGNSWAVGLAFQIHLVVVAFIMGIAIFAPLAELAGLRGGGEHWERLARTLSSTIVRFFSFGATWAVLALVLLFGLFPRLFGILTAIFYWPLFVVAGLWFAMTLSAYLYYHTWDRLAQRRGLHMSIGWTFAGSAFLFITLITMLSSYQLTPTASTHFPTAAFNPSWLAEIIHRHIGNLSYAGLLLASYAGWRFLFTATSNSGDRAYYDWLGHVGLLLGAGLALLQPVGGWFYARQIQHGSPGAFFLMMIGENSWLWLIQSFLFGELVFLGNVYLSEAVERGNPSPGAIRWMRNSLWIIAILVLLLIVPKSWPLGTMMPWKYISLVGLVVLSVVNLIYYLRARKEFVWGRVGWRSQAALAILGIVIVALLVTMGIIRSTARGGYLIYERLGPEQSQQIEQQRED